MTCSCFQRWRHQSCFLVTAWNHSRQRQSKTYMDEWVSFCYLFHVLNLHLPVSHTGECLCVSAPGLGLFCLCDVAVLVCRGLASLDVLLIDEHLDALLDHADTWVEPGFGLIDDLHTGTVENSHLMLQVKLQWLTDFMSTIKWFTSYFYHQLKLKWRSLGNLIINGRNLWFW